MYVGMESQVSRIVGEKEQENKEHEDVKVGKSQEENKNVRAVDDGLLLVVSARIHGHNVRAFIDSGATRCFITPTCITAVGLKGVPKYIFLELGNGQKYLSQGYVPNIPIVTAGLTVKVGLTITNLMVCVQRW